ncbi:VOC family protein [bacterium]|nr:VOC family protein [bacterium]
MRIEHVAIWTQDLQALKEFYCKWFQAEAGPKYANEVKGFESYFLTFPSGARLELMRTGLEVEQTPEPTKTPAGYAHIAFSTGSEIKVDSLTEQLREAGYTVFDEPRRTGDGYYESVVLDPDGNRVEITV